MRPRFLCDVDGVLADFTSAALAIVEGLTGEKPPHDARQEWDLFRSYPRGIREAAYERMRQPEFCRNLEPYDGALEGLDRVSKVADVYFVTSPLGGPHWTHEREEWLMRHLGYSARYVVHTSAKHLCIGDVFLDDKPDNVVTWAAHHPGKAALLWPAPHNAQTRDVAIPGVRRVRQWRDVYNEVVRAAGGS